MKKRRMTNMKTLWMAGFLVAAISTMFTMAGCSKDTAESITNPVSSIFKPKGTIQGVVVDAVSREPIVGARVSVGVGEATTDEMGQYVIKDVPATTDALNGTVGDVYYVSVDLRNSTKPINMKTATEKYPEFSYRTVSVSFTSLNDTECPDTTNYGYAWEPINCTNSTNHDTRVDGLVASLPIEIGRLACNIKGTVYGCFGPDYATPQSAEVRLDSGDDSDNTGSGHYDNIISTVDTDPEDTGTFEFNNIECGGRNFEVVAADSFDNPTMHDVLDTTGPDGNGETLVLHLDQCEYGYGGDCSYSLGDDPSKDRALHLCPNDDMGPRIVEVTPEDGSDLAQASSQTAVFKFHEGVLQTAYATGITASGVDNLYDNVEVSYDGSKASNVSYSLAWLPASCTDNCTQLQVTFPTGTSSRYHVTLMNLDNLTDAAGNQAVPGDCPNISGDDCTVAFSTTGGNTPAQVTDLVLKNDASLDEAGVNVGQYDWSIVSGAKRYAMYCQKVQVWGSTTQDGPFVRDDPNTPMTYGEILNDGIGDDDGVCEDTYPLYEASYGGCGMDGMSTSGSSGQVDFDILADGLDDGAAFVENSEIELRYNCQVAGLNADGVEGAVSAIATDPADDEVGPELQEDGSDLGCPTTGVDPSDSGSICTDGTNIDQIVLELNEELNETVAETGTNYVISGMTSGSTAPTVTTAVYSAADDSVTLTLSAVLNPLNLLATRVTTGANGVANTTAAGSDTQGLAVGSGAAGGSATTPCVLDNGPLTTVASGDTLVTTNGVREILAGGDLDCDTTAVSADGDVQLSIIGNSNGRPAGTCATDVTPFIATAGGDDTQVVGGDGADTGEDYFTVGPNGICETTAGTGDTQHIAVGSGIANTTAVYTGGDGLLDTETLNTGTGTADDAREGGKVTVSNVTDIGGNVIRTTGDEYFSDGSVR